MKDKIEFIAPKYAPGFSIKSCQHLLSFETRKFWKGHPRPGNRKGSDICGRIAKYRIGKKNYCQVHAAIECLQKCAERGEV